MVTRPQLQCITEAVNITHGSIIAHRKTAQMQ